MYIADLGYGTIWEKDTFSTTSCGSLYYASPGMSYLSNSLLTYSPLEIVSPNGMYIGPEVDIWSMGCVLYVITTGRLPFLGMYPVSSSLSDVH